MKKTLSLCLVAFSCHVNLASAESVSFNEQKVSEAYEVMGQQYTTFAKMFNVCQKKPDLPECGDEYDIARSKYERAKSNYDVLKMTNIPALLSLEAPIISYPDIATSLVKLDLMVVEDPSAVTYESLIKGVNNWLKKEGQEEVDSISMFTMQAIIVEASSPNSKV